MAIARPPEPVELAPVNKRVVFGSKEGAVSYKHLVAKVMGYPKQGVCAGGWPPPPGGGMTLYYESERYDEKTKQWYMHIPAVVEAAPTTKLDNAEKTALQMGLLNLEEYDPAKTEVAEIGVE
jgi:hypothetical protein